MNGLSWMLYWADVVDGLDDLAKWLVAIALFGCVVGLLLLIPGFDDDMSKEDMAEARKWSRRFIVSGLCNFVFFAALAATLPSKDTMYAIAASEMGERVLESKTVTKAQAALDAWLDRQIGAPAQEKPK